MAWDLVADRETPRRLSTPALLDARGLRAALAGAARRPNPHERALLEALTERIAADPGADGLRDEVVRLRAGQ